MQLYKGIRQGVAFIPLLVTLGLSALGLFLTLSPIIHDINSAALMRGYFEVRTSETATAVLTALLTGLISITVFGFSMMIVVVNQAASIYSPKVVQALSSEQSNQYILGFDLGTIIFTLIVMMHIDNEKADGGIPEIAIFVSMLLAITALILFIKFINNISNSVRINNIVQMLYDRTRKSIKHSSRHLSPSKEIPTDNWRAYNAAHAGFFQMIRRNSLVNHLRELDLVLKVLPKPGTYYLRNEPLFCVNRDIDEETVQDLRDNFLTYHGENISDNHMYGFRQLREVAVKSMSPGINDPGVAILCVEHLTELLCLALDRENENTICDDEGEVRVILSTFDFESLFKISFVPIKTYGKRDYNVIGALLRAVGQISRWDHGRKFKHLLNKFALDVIEEARESITSSIEVDALNERIGSLNTSGYFQMELMRSAQSR